MGTPRLRLDVVTIFPEYLEPLRHALLGKAIEQGILSVGVHNLRDWASGNHKAVDGPPMGGGPGMVMKPEVWGPALDDIAAAGPAGATAGRELDSAAPHRNDRARHDDLASTAPRPYDDVRDESERGKPLLLVPTPTGTPFTQSDARAWSREEHIVFACGRYEGIDQRVFDDAEARYRVREVSIGDYVLIGGEVAVLVIAEAVTRLIPGVLGNTESHEEDSFSDGLLEGPSYTKPRQWRGIDVPNVLLSGDHAKIGRWRRDQSLKKTQKVRPELIAAAREAGTLDADDLFSLDARPVETNLAAMMDPQAWRKTETKLRKQLRRAGYIVDELDVEEADSVCIPDNLVVTQYMQDHDRPPADPVYRLVLKGRTALAVAEATRVVVDKLPCGEYWTGTTTDLGG